MFPGPSGRITRFPHARPELPHCGRVKTGNSRLHRFRLVSLDCMLDGIRRCLDSGAGRAMQLGPASSLAFAAPYAADDVAIARRLLGTARLSADREARIDRTASRLIEA